MSIKKAMHQPLVWGLVFLVVNLLQAALSPVDADEAYYWMYSQQLDWGYFDHPPVVALLVAVGSSWLPGALGLRLGHVLIGCLLAWVIWQLLDRPKGKYVLPAILLIAVQPMIQVYSFIATPDGPLLLFSALLLWQFKKFLSQPTGRTAVALGIIMAGLLYSKYHGLLLILFLVLPNFFFLVRQPWAWFAAGLGAALYLPHLYWQYLHDFPSFRYHLSGRNDPYELKYTLEFLLNQLVIFNPFLLYFYWRATVAKVAQRGPEAAFRRTCRWLVFLTLGFFLYSTSRGGTEAQWTAMLCIPLVYLVFKSLEDHPQWIRPLRIIGFVSLGLFLVARLVLIAPRDWLPFSKPFDAEPWVLELAEQAGDLPVFFENSYRDASHYQFYANKPAWTFTDTNYRPNQFDLWQDDTLYHHQRVLIMGQKNWNTTNGEAFTTARKQGVAKVVDNFQVAKYAEFSLSHPLPDTLLPGQKLPIKIVANSRMELDQEQPVLKQPIRLDTELSLQLFAIFQFIGDGWYYFPLKPLTTKRIAPGGSQLIYEGELKVPDDLPQVEMQFQLGIGYEGMPPLRGQSTLQPIIIHSPDN